MAARSPLITVMVGAAMKAARGLKRDFGEVEHLQASRKGPSDFVSKADHTAEQIIVEELSRTRPGFSFLLEEQGVIKGDYPDLVFIVDPLDGTTNFLHGIPHFAISIALQEGDQVIAGVIYDPIKDELFWAEKGKGAWLESTRLRVSARRELTDAVLGTGIPHKGRGDHEEFLAISEAFMAQVAGIRRFGAAALDLAYVAAGRFDGFWELALHPWDVAAGALIVREAGGYVSDYAGRDRFMDNGEIVASNDRLHGKLVKQIGDIRRARRAAATASN